MGFVNEKLTKEQREGFVAKGIINPASDIGRVLNPLYWTIDRDKDMCLIDAGVHRDFYDEHYFLFFWNNEPHIISLIQEYGDETNSVLWCKKAHVSEYVFSDNESFVDDLRDALRVFKFDGTPSELNMCSSAIINF